MTKISTVEFDNSELLISRTDTRGVILAANQAFERVSGFNGEELLNAPHKIVRHPDMPKGLFWMVWDKIQRNEPACAYIKNAIKGGGHYWVFASLAPLQGGYMSMRVRPSEDMVEQMSAIYEKILIREQKEDLTPEESGKAIVEIIKAEGFHNYEDFMARKISTELLTREEALGRHGNKRSRILSEALETWSTVATECSNVFEAYDKFRPTASNMRVQAALLNDSGLGLGVIASQFASIASSINSDLTELSTGVGDVEKTIHNVLILTGFEQLLEESEKVLRSEASSTGENGSEFDIMTRQRIAYHDKARTGLEDVARELQRFFAKSQEVKRSLTGLSVTRVMCAIENAQITTSVENSISAIIDELALFQTTSESSLGVIRNELQSIRDELVAA